jgi:hypothetical protein
MKGGSCMAQRARHRELAARLLSICANIFILCIAVELQLRYLIGIFPSAARKTCQTTFYEFMPVMLAAIIDMFSSFIAFFFGQRHQLVQSLPSFFVFVLISTSSSRWEFIPPPSA